MQSGKKPQIVQTYEDGFTLVLSEACDYMYAVGANILRNTNGKYCGRLSPVGSVFYAISLSYLLPKNSSLATPISQATLAMRDTNALLPIQEFNSKQMCRSQASAAVVRFPEFVATRVQSGLSSVSCSSIDDVVAPDCFLYVVHLPGRIGSNLNGSS
jgi:hypothetical protein